MILVLLCYQLSHLIAAYSETREDEGVDHEMRYNYSIVGRGQSKICIGHGDFPHIRILDTRKST